MLVKNICTAHASRPKPHKESACWSDSNSVFSRSQTKANTRIFIILTKNTLGVKKSCSQEFEKGLDEKEVKSKMGCVVLLLNKIKF